MAHLNHRGPEENGPKTGRKLGLCNLKNNENTAFSLGQGMGMRRHNCEDSQPGKGKR